MMARITGTRDCEICGSRFNLMSNRSHRPQRYCSQLCAARAPKNYATLCSNKKPGPVLGRDWNKSPKLRPVLHPTTHDIAWAAGIYDGEGSLCLQKRAPNAVQINVGQKDRWIPQKLRDLFGGSVCERTMNGQPFYYWLCSGARARGFLMTIYSFQSPRRQVQLHKALGLPLAA